MSQGEAAGDGQPDPGTAGVAGPGRVGAVEPFEHLRELLRGEAIAGVGDRDPHPRRGGGPERRVAERCLTERTASELFDAGADCLTLGNHFARWEPRFTDEMTGMMDRPLGIRFLSGPVADDPVHLELAWDRTSIMVQVRPEGLRVETTTGWLPGALRKVAYGRTRALTDEQKRDGFQATIWLHPDGALTTDVDGVTYSHTPFPSYPREFKQFPMTDIRLTARMAAYTRLPSCRSKVAVTVTVMPGRAEAV